MDVLKSFAWYRTLRTLGCMVLAHGWVAAQDFQETDLKAVFLLRFGSFTHWPESALPEPDQPFVIGILGRDPFGAVIDEVVRGETVAGRPVEVRRFHRVEDALRSSILYISESEAPRLPAILRALRGRPTLTVSDMDYFAPSGGMVRFVTQHQRVRLRINLNAVRAAGLNLSSKLLRAADLVPPQPPPP